MSAADDAKELKGLARSIDALFQDETSAADKADAVNERPAAEASGMDVPDEEPAVEASGMDVPDEELAAEASGMDVPDEEAAAGADRGEGGPEAPADEMVWEEVKEPEVELGPPDPEALAHAVDRFLASDPLARDGLGTQLRQAAMALREARQFDPIVAAVERLVLETGDPPDEACLAMAQVLLAPGVSSRIVAMLGSERDEGRRGRLMLLCRRLGHEMAVAIADALSATNDRFARRTYLDCMVSMGDAAMPVVESMAEDTRWFVVRNALAILGEVGGDRAVELVTATLAHTDPRVRKEGLMALAKVGGEDAGLLVYGMLEDPDADVRLAAAMAAGALKVERALRPLLGLLDGEDDPDVIVGILRALGQLGDPGAVQAIEKRAVGSFFNRPPTPVRIAAYRALHHIGTPHARELLQAAVDDKDPEVRAAVRQIVGY